MTREGMETASYTVYKVGSTYYAKSHLHGGTNYSGADASTVINNALNALTGGRTWKEKVVLKGNLTIDSPVLIDSYTIFVINGKLTLANGVNDYMLKGKVETGMQDVEIIGGELSCNKDNQNSGGGIRFVKVNRLLLQDTTITNPYARGLVIDGGSNSDAWIENIKVYNAGELGISLLSGRYVYASKCYVYDCVGADAFRVYQINDYETIYKVTDCHVRGSTTTSGFKVHLTTDKAVVTFVNCSVYDTEGMG